MSSRPRGAAALRHQAETGLGGTAQESRPERHLSPPRVVPFSLAAAGVCALSGIGVLPTSAAVGLDAGALLCYLVALRSGLPRWPELPWRRLQLLNGMQPALLPTAAFVSAAIALGEQPGLPGLAIMPPWIWLTLTVCPWLELAEERRSSLRWGPTVLALLAISVPLPLFVLAMSPSVSAPVRAATVALAVLVPTWRLITLTYRNLSRAWLRSATIAVLVGAAAGMSVLLRVAVPFLPVALLLGWYGLAGVVSQRDRRSTGAFAVFVVLAAIMLAVANPL
ncbi:MAG TPA: hypothetical protein VI138_06885 [Candidatus Dormibacteraeota bacterium]